MDTAVQEFPFPAIWEDDTRMNVLFSPFRSKTINPVDWDSKLKFWQELILEYCLHHKQTTFNLESIKKAFSRKGKTPSCIENVVEEMLRAGLITYEDSYKNYSLVGESILAWTARLLIKDPVRWAFNKMKSPFSVKLDSNTTRYVHLSATQKISEEFISTLPDKLKGHLIDLKSVSALCDIKDQENLKIILRPLVEQREAVIAVLPNKTLVKFAKNHEKLSPVSEIDLGVYELERTEESLEKSLESLEEEKEAALKEVKKCLAENKRHTAKSWLRRKNELEKYIDKRASALDNIRCLLDRIRLAESDSLVLDAYKKGVAALKETMKTTGLTENRTEETMDELEDVLDVHNEIEATLARSLDPEADSTLESELAELLIDSAPDVPPTGPASTNSGDSGLGVDSNLNIPDPAPSPLELPELPTVPKPTFDDMLEARIKALAL